MIHKNGQNFIESKQKEPKTHAHESKVEILNVEAKQWMKCFDFLDCDVKEGGTLNSFIHFLREFLRAFYLPTVTLTNKIILTSSNGIILLMEDPFDQLLEKLNFINGLLYIGKVLHLFG